MQQTDRAIDWQCDPTDTVLRKVHAADGFPGVADTLFGQACHIHDARAYPGLGTPGALLGRVGDGVVRATVDGAVWIGHAKRPGGIKLPVAVTFPEAVGLPVLADDDGVIRYEERTAVGILHFDFYNGAMGTAACERLRVAYLEARQRPTKVIVLAGSADFFSNGLDLKRIEAADSPPDESWRNINAMDDLCQAIIETDSHLTVAALVLSVLVAPSSPWRRIASGRAMASSSIHITRTWAICMARSTGPICCLDASARTRQRRSCAIVCPWAWPKQSHSASSTHISGPILAISWARRCAMPAT